MRHRDDDAAQRWQWLSQFNLTEDKPMPGL